MKVVIDTNVMLVSISRRSSLNWIYQRLLNGDFILCLTTDILAEYAEKVEEHMSAEIAEDALKAILNLHNIEKVDIYFRWNLTINDPDDNKYADCAIAANADYLVTHDSDFNILKRIPFPKISVVSGKEFKDILELEKR